MNQAQGLASVEPFPAQETCHLSWSASVCFAHDPQLVFSRESAPSHFHLGGWWHSVVSTAS